jgi:hypothetical protein
MWGVSSGNWSSSFCRRLRWIEDLSFDFCGVVILSGGGLVEGSMELRGRDGRFFEHLGGWGVVGCGVWGVVRDVSRGAVASRSLLAISG